MADRHDITLREAEGGGPPGVLDELKRAVGELFPETKTFAKNYVRGKGEVELAKVAEIKGRVLASLGNLEIERQRLIEDRNQRLRSDENDLAKAAMGHAEKMYELKTQRLKTLVETAVALKDLGVRINLTKVAKELVSALAEDDSFPPEGPQGSTE